DPCRRLEANSVRAGATWGTTKAEPPLSQLFKISGGEFIVLSSSSLMMPGRQTISDFPRTSVTRGDVPCVVASVCRGTSCIRSVWQKRRRQQHRRDAGHNLPPRIHDQAGDVAGRYDAPRRTVGDEPIAREAVSARRPQGQVRLRLSNRNPTIGSGNAQSWKPELGRHL